MKKTSDFTPAAPSSNVMREACENLIEVVDRTADTFAWLGPIAKIKTLLRALPPAPAGGEDKISDGEALSSGPRSPLRISSQDPASRRGEPSPDQRTPENPVVGSEQWRPIETAPRDGTRFLCATEGEDDSIEITEYFTINNPTFEEVENGLYRRIENPYSAWNGNGHRATHWMPLPAPPPSINERSMK